MKKSALFFYIVFILGVLALTSCAASGNSAVLTASAWKLASYGSPSNPKAALPDKNSSVVFGKDGRMNGNVGCNSFGGEYTVSANQIKFGPIMRTMMACQGPVMQQEDAVMQVFSGTVKYSLASGNLIITSANGETVVTFVPAGK